MPARVRTLASDILPPPEVRAILILGGYRTQSQHGSTIISAFLHLKMIDLLVSDFKVEGWPCGEMRLRDSLTAPSGIGLMRPTSRSNNNEMSIFKCIYTTMRGHGEVTFLCVKLHDGPSEIRSCNACTAPPRPRCS